MEGERVILSSHVVRGSSCFPYISNRRTHGQASRWISDSRGEDVYPKDTTGMRIPWGSEDATVAVEIRKMVPGRFQNLS
jgi:hypothetical protein